MTRFQVDVQIGNRLKRNLNSVRLFGPVNRQFLEDVTGDLKEEAQDTAPFDLGNLKRSHVAEVDARQLPQWGEVRVEEETAIFVHEGTRPHWAPIRALEPWALRHGINPYALQRAIARRGTRPQPWFENATAKIAGRLPVYVRHAARAIRRRWDS